jgi:hypothetical protein
MNGQEVSALMRWFCAKAADHEKAAETRRQIAIAQREMVKAYPPQMKIGGNPRKAPITLSDEEWRGLLTSGKTRTQILRETGVCPRTIVNRASALGLQAP